MSSITYTKKYITEFVYGATDGTITTFAIISGVMGASLSPLVIFVLGISNVLADGFSMAASNYLSFEEGGEQNKTAFKTSVVTFISFVSIGIIPLIPFILALVIPMTTAMQFGISIACTGIAFIIIGITRGVVTGKNKYLSMFQTLLIGGIAAVIAYGVGYGLDRWIV
jgi:vacuolar iron transporter family protein